MDLNIFLFQKINNFALKNLFFDEIGIFFAKYFEFIFVASLLLILIYNHRKYFSILSLAFLSALLARLGFTEAIRSLFYHPRPFEIIPVNLLVSYGSTPSFPSGHASFYFALGFFIFFQDKKTGTYALASAFLISLARIYVGIHWPFDIIGGFFVGLFSALIVEKFKERHSRKLN